MTQHHVYAGNKEAGVTPHKPMDDDYAQYCHDNDIHFVPYPTDSLIPPPLPPRGKEKSVSVVMLLVYVVGWAGGHNFYLHRPVLGIIELAISIVTYQMAGFLFVWLFSMIEMLLYMASSKTRWKTDGRGYLLTK